MYVNPVEKNHTVRETTIRRRLSETTEEQIRKGKELRKSTVTTLIPTPNSFNRSNQSS